jgi:two-component system, chemotaxis family, CheB/CheR fusion protein
VAAARKTTRSTVLAKSRTKHTAVKRQPVTPTLPAPEPTPSSGLSAELPGFLIVGIGASAGGLETMQESFCPMPPSSVMAFVVVSHQHVDHVSLLPTLLGKCTAMPMVEATDGREVDRRVPGLGRG